MAVQIPKWRVGEELPPFADPSIVPTLNGILDGSIVVAPIELASGAALQLYYLVFHLRPTGLLATTYADFYVVLCSLARGAHSRSRRRCVRAA